MHVAESTFVLQEKFFIVIIVWFGLWTNYFLYQNGFSMDQK